MRHNASMRAPTFPSRVDFAFWQAMQRRPQWANRFADGVGIDAVVNAHTGIHPTSGEVAAANMLVMMRGRQRRRSSVEELLRQLAAEDASDRRAIFARKWLARLSAV